MKRKPSRFNRCVSKKLSKKSYKGKKTWQSEFAKAVCACSKKRMGKVI